MTDFDNVIHEIVTDKKEKAFYIKKYPLFFERCPVLSNKLFEPDFDSTMLSYMMEQKSKIFQNEFSEHEASVNVGTNLVNKYIKPLLNP